MCECLFQNSLQNISFSRTMWWSSSDARIQVTRVATTRLTLDWIQPDRYLSLSVDCYLEKYYWTESTYIKTPDNIIFIADHCCEITRLLVFCPDCLNWSESDIEQLVVGVPTVRHSQLLAFVFRCSWHVLWNLDLHWFGTDQWGFEVDRPPIRDPRPSKPLTDYFPENSIFIGHMVTNENWASRLPGWSSWQS